MAAFVAILTVAAYAGLAHSILPQQCNANFRWDDCGRRPQPVIYYWRTGSRCEVGIWRGCLPNMNMFKDEYECVSTCIFTVRARHEDFHQLNKEDRDDTENLPTDGTTDVNDGNVTMPYANVTADTDQNEGGENATDQNKGDGPEKTTENNENTNTNDSDNNKPKSTDLSTAKSTNSDSNAPTVTGTGTTVGETGITTAAETTGTPAE